MSDYYQTASVFATISTDLLLDAKDNDAVASLVAEDASKRMKALLESESRPKTGSDRVGPCWLDDSGVNATSLSKSHKLLEGQQLFKISVPINLGALDDGRHTTNKYTELVEHKAKMLVQAWLEGANAVRGQIINSTRPTAAAVDDR